jgi:hypothetical protein
VSRNGFKKWFAYSPVASWLRTFAAIVLAMFIADGADVFAVDATDLRTWIAAALSSTLPAIVRALNPDDHAFGRGAGVKDPFDVWEDE